MPQKADWELKIAPELKNADPAIFGRIIVELTGKGTDEVLAIVRACHGEVLCRATKIIPILVAKVPLSALQAMARSKQVKRLLVDKPIRALADKMREAAK